MVKTLLKQKSLVLSFLAIFSVLSTHSQNVNVALNKPVSVFPVIEGNNPKNLVDGDIKSLFIAYKYTPLNRILVDLKDIYTIDRILMRGFRGLDESQIKNASQKPDEHWRILVYENDNDSIEVFSGVLPAKKLISFQPVKARKVVVEFSTIKEKLMGELEIYAYDPMPVMVNQSGYNTLGYKRFTAPLAHDGTEFQVVNVGDNSQKVFYRGIIQKNIGDFTSFQPQEIGPYTIKVLDKENAGVSFPFLIEPYLMERVSYLPAIRFMIDNRCWYGCMQEYKPTDIEAGCPALGVAWRDSHQFSFELQALINMYFVNPDAFTVQRMPLEGIYSGLRYQVASNTPEIVRLIHWAVEVYLGRKVNHTLLKEQLAYFLYAYPELEQYIPRVLYEKTRDYLFSVWGDDAIDRWQWHDIEHTGNLFQTYTIIGTGKGHFPPGHSVIPNLMMYEVAKREKRKDAERYYNAAYNQTEWLIKNLDWNDPLTTKGQRMTEWVTVDALSYFYNHYPTSKQPTNLYKKMEDWAKVVISRSDNMWDMRKYSSEKFVIPDFRDKTDPNYNPEGSFNEPGNIAGFSSPALQVAVILRGEIAERLKQIATAQMDNVFGRNPTGRHFSYRAVRDFDGAELGWFQDWDDGAAQLHTVRGVLDGSPKEEVYPFNPYGGDPGHTEGWVTFQTAWMQGIAQASKSQTSIKILDVSGNSTNTIQPTQNFKIELSAPLNFKMDKKEEAKVRIYRNEKTYNELILTEDDVNSLTFSTRVTLKDLFNTRWRNGEVLKVVYGYGHMQTSKEFIITYK